jgi:mRNA-degrading endonuclease RelE of RelBE toxin-antitoxin system
MSYSVVFTHTFEKELKVLKKKYPSLKHEYAELVENLETNPIQGTPLGKDCYKIRLAIRSKGKGKSGGARVITCLRVLRETVILLTIFDKSEKENISDRELERLIAEVG